MSQIYTDGLGNEYIAFSFDGYNYDKDRFKVYMTLCVYNLTEKKIVYTKFVNNKTLEKNEWDDATGKICYFDSKLLIGKGKTIYCYDAFKDEGGSKWEHSTLLNDGIGYGSGNDNVIKVLVNENVGLVYCMDHLIGINLTTGKPIYHVSAIGNTNIAIIDKIIYQRDGSDLQMRDPRTGKELKRVATPPNEQAFSSSRPNGKDGKIYIHSYTHAYCIKAWGK
jgi:outer membrane protein assembly factor BamB